MEPVAGLQPVKTHAQNGNDGLVSCIGAIASFKDTNGSKDGKLSPSMDVILTNPVPIYLSGIKLTFAEGRIRFETSIVNGAIKTHPFIEVPRDEVKLFGMTFRRNSKSKLIRVTKASISRRVLRVGVHNGHSLFGDAYKWSEIELEPSDSNQDVLICNKKSYSVPIFYDHSYCALVILLTYSLELSVSAYDRSVIRSYSKRLQRSTQSNLTAGYQIVLPCQRDGAQQDITGTLSVHESLRHDAHCERFSDCPIHTPSLLKEALLDMRVHLQPSKQSLNTLGFKGIEIPASDIDSHVSSLTGPSTRNLKVTNEEEGEKIRIVELKGYPFDSDSKDADECVKKPKNIQVSTQTSTGFLPDANTSVSSVHRDIHINQPHKECTMQREGVSRKGLEMKPRRMVETVTCLSTIIHSISSYLWGDENLQCSRCQDSLMDCNKASSSCIHETFFATMVEFLCWYRNERKRDFLQSHVDKILN
jgi:hypothetical protein